MDTCRSYATNLEFATDRDALLPEIEGKLSRNDPTRVLSWVRPHDYSIERSYKADSRMTVLLGYLITMLVSMTALGIVGLASFSVNVRTRQIGTRRALGARRIDILRYFMVENWLLTTGGAIVGTIFSFAFSYWLSNVFQLPKLNALFVGAGVVCMWLIGQIAVLLPARRAASIPPGVATRTV